MPDKSLPRKKFRTKVLAVFLLIVIIPIILIFLSNLYLVIKARQANIIEQEYLALDNANEKIFKYLQEKSNGLNFAVSSSHDSVRKLALEDLEFLLKNSLVSSRPLSLEFIDSDGFVIAKARPDDGIFYSTSYLEDAELSTGTLRVIPKLRQISDAEADMSGSPDYQTAIRGYAYYGLLEFKDGVPVMRIASQIQNQNGGIIGVVSAEIGLGEVEEMIEQIRLGERGYLFIVDKKGTVIASANKEIAKVGDSLIEERKVAEFLVEGASDKKGFETTLNKSNERVVWAAEDIPGVEWYAVSEWPITDAFSVLSQLFKYSTIITLAILLGVVVMGLVFTRTITRPIRVLTKGAKEIKKGNLDHEISLKTNDEFEMLAGRFNEMIKVLKENQKLRDEFVFIAAHELRTPVTAIKGYLSMVLENSFGEVPKDIKDNLLIVNSANDRLVQLVQDLLEVARSDAGKMKIDMKAVEISGKIKQVMSELKSLSDEKGIKVEYDASNQVSVMADEYKLNEIIVNLLGNAIKYTTSNGDIKIWHEEKDGFVVTHMKDHGIGMTKEEQSKLFSKFYRVQNEHTNQIEGTGLGLFICKEIIERMGGQIWVESEKGEGSTFSFSLKKP